jgi:hypothetical protein
MPTPDRVHRQDFAGSTSKVTRTPQGGLRLDAAITRVGVLTYTDTNGKTWREYKPADEVFKADSLATLEGAPVTELHPEKLVDGANWKTVSVGHLIGAPRRDGDFVVAPVAVQDAGTAGRVEAHELHDVSAGYTCRVDWTAGVTPDGEPYDAVQRDIVYNHAALGPEGWGRAGTEVSLRMDGAACQVRGDSPAPRSTMKKTLKIRGREHKLDADDEMKAAQDAVDDLAEQAAAADSLGAKLEAAQTALTTAVGELAALRAKMEAEEKAEPKPITEDMVPEEVADALASKRLALRQRAAKVLGGDVKLDGLKAHEIHKLVVAKALPSVKLDSLDAKVVEGMFVAATDGASDVARANSLRNAHPGPPVDERNDANDDENLSPAAALAARTHSRFDNRGRAATERA